MRKRLMMSELSRHWKSKELEDDVVLWRCSGRCSGALSTVEDIWFLHKSWRHCLRPNNRWRHLWQTMSRTTHFIIAFSPASLLNSSTGWPVHTNETRTLSTKGENITFFHVTSEHVFGDKTDFDIKHIYKAIKPFQCQQMRWRKCLATCLTTDFRNSCLWWAFFLEMIHVPGYLKHIKVLSISLHFKLAGRFKSI